MMDADGLLEMFHCPYEGCSQVYVALSSFQVRPPPGAAWARPTRPRPWHHQGVLPLVCPLEFDEVPLKAKTGTCHTPHLAWEDATRGL